MHTNYALLATLALLLALAVFLITPAPTGLVTSQQAGGVAQCQEINTSGEYVLQGPINSTGTCVLITADNVTLDGQAHTISYSSNQTSYAVHVANASNVYLTNFSAQHLNASPGSGAVIYLDNTTYVTLTHVSAASASNVSALKIHQSANTQLASTHLNASYALHASNNTQLTLTNNTLLAAQTAAWLHATNAFNASNNHLQAPTTVSIDALTNTTVYNNTFNASYTHVHATNTSAVLAHNTFLGVGVWVNSSSSNTSFNTTVNGVAQGNTYPGIEYFSFFDTTNDGYADSGNLPLTNQTTSNWIGASADYAPVTTRTGRGPLLNLANPPNQTLLAQEAFYLDLNASDDWAFNGTIYLANETETQLFFFNQSTTLNLTNQSTGEYSVWAHASNELSDNTTLPNHTFTVVSNENFSIQEAVFAQQERTANEQALQLRCSYEPRMHGATTIHYEILRGNETYYQATHENATEQTLYNLTTINSASTQPGEVWSARCQARTSAHNTSWYNTTPTIINHPPSLNATFSEGGLESEELVAACQASDADGDELTISYQWFVDGDEFSSGTGSGASLSAEELQASDTWTIECAADDGIETTTESQSITIQPLVQVQALAQPIPAYTNESVTGTCLAEQANNQTPTVQLEWLREEEVQEATSASTNNLTQTLISTQTSVNDFWTLRCTATSGSYNATDFYELVIQEEPTPEDALVINSANNVVSAENQSAGQVVWTGASISEADAQEHITIRHNYIYVNTNALLELDFLPAQIRFYNLSFQDPQLLRNNEVCDSCEILSYEDGELVAQVPGFSTYTTQETPEPEPEPEPVVDESPEEEQPQEEEPTTLDAPREEEAPQEAEPEANPALYEQATAWIAQNGFVAAASATAVFLLALFSVAKQVGSRKRFLQDYVNQHCQELSDDELHLILLQAGVKESLAKQLVNNRAHEE